MSIQMSQLHGLGQAEIIAAILGPVVTGGADIYRTSEESKLSKSELKRRAIEFAQMSQFQKERAEAADQARLVAQHLDMQQRALRGAWWERNLPLIAGAAVLVALAVTAATTKRR